jgi:hypothetical protein
MTRGALPPTAFFSFAEITDPGKHAEFNDYHQLDHRPANLALPGVYWGERFVRTPRCMEASTAPDARYQRYHYFNYYLFRDSTPETRAEWTQLGSLAAYWGRKPDHSWSERTTGFYTTLKGYSNPRVRVPAEVVPMRPNLGVHVALVGLHGDPDAVDRFGRWYDLELMPAVMACSGAAGALSFVSEDGFPVGRPATPDVVPTLATVVFLEGDPVAFAGELAGTPGGGSWVDESGTGELQFSGPLETITPWKWDWFDA